MIQAPAASIDPIKQRVPLAFFYSPSHRAMFTSLIDFYEEHGGNGYKGSLDIVVLQERLRELNKLDQVGGEQAVRAYFVEAAVPSALDYHIELLREKFLRRETISTAQALIRHATDETADISTTVERSLFRVEQLGAISTPQKSDLSIRTISQLLGMTFDDSDNYFGDRILCAGQPCTFLGPGGIGKTRVCLQLALCMITGRPFLDLETHAPGKKWLFIQTENSNRRLHFDLKNMVKALSLTESDLSQLESCLYIHTLENDSDAFVNLRDDHNYASISNLIRDVDPDFIQWDPLNSLTDADLNADVDMRAIVSAISKITRSGGKQTRVPFVIHHSLTGKTGAARAVGWDKASYGRNSKVLQAWTRAQINLAPRTADDPNLLIMSCGKNNNGKAFPEIGVEFDENTGIYIRDESFSPEEFREDVGLGARKTPVSVDSVVALVQDKIPRPKLVERLRAKFDISQATAYRVIDRAESENRIRKEEDVNWRATYFLVEPKPSLPYSDA